MKQEPVPVVLCTGLTCVMDALALGKPIISVRNPYFPFDIEKEKCGLYVKPESPYEIVEAVRKMESDYNLYEKACINSKRMSLQYNMSKYVVELCKSFESSL